LELVRGLCNHASEPWSRNNCTNWILFYIKTFKKGNTQGALETLGQSGCKSIGCETGYGNRYDYWPFYSTRNSRVIGLAVGLAFQDPILNVISGIILSVRDRPFKLGDLIRTNGHYGHVKRITIRTTIIKSLTGEEIIIPNKSVVQNPLVNYSFSTNRRVDIACGVEYSSDLEEVQKTAVNAIENSIKELDGKEVEFMFTEFGDSSINFTLRYWIEETGEKNFLISRGAFDEKGISIPFPIRTLEFSQKNVVEGLSSGKKS
jgi:small-conductance mechanosensitive channel